MNLSVTKQAILSLVEGGPLEPTVQASLLSGVRRADTASELAGQVAGVLPGLYRVYGGKLKDALQGTLTPDVWQQQGVLFDPTSIPSDGPDAYLVLAGDAPVTQTVDKKVTYLGNVNGLIEAGTAHLVDARGDMLATGQAKVYALGASCVNAAGAAEVFYLDRSRGLVKENAVAHAHGRSYVCVAEGQVTLHAHDMAQFHVFQGRATIYADGSARGLVAPVPEQPNRIELHLSGGCFVCTKEDGYRAVVVDTADFTGTILRLRTTPVAASLLLNLITTRTSEVSPAETGLTRPMAIDQLKNDLKSFMDDAVPSEVAHLLFNAEDERTVCLHMASVLPQLVANGLTGEFLRTHFTEAALEANLIHAFSRPEAERTDRHDRGTHYFFGDQLVHGKNYEGDVCCYERCLLLAENNRNVLQVGDQATAIALGTGNLTINGVGRALGLDYANITAGDYAWVDAYGESFVKASGHAWVNANQYCGVEADEHCRVHLAGKSVAQLSGYVHALVVDNASVSADDHVVVGYREEHKPRRQVVTALSPTVQVWKLDTEKAREKFYELLKSEDEGMHRSKGRLWRV